MATLSVHRHLLGMRTTPQTRTVAPEALAEALAAELANRLRDVDPGGSGVWCIRRLDIRLAVAATLGPREAATLLARVLMRELDRAAAARGGADPDVLWFPDRGGYLARWLVNVSRGTAEDRWEYRQLVPSSGSLAMRIRAETEPEPMLLALRGLPQPDLDAVLETMSPADASAVALAVAVAPSAAGEDAVAVARTVRALVESGRLTSDQRRATLAALLAGADAPSPAAAAHARDLVQLAFALRAWSWRDRDQLVHALTAGNWSEVARFGSAEIAAAWASWSQTERVAAVTELTATAPSDSRSRAGRDDADEQDGVEHAHSKLGAIFLLLPLLAALPFGQATEGWPPLAESPAVAGLELLAVLGVLGEGRARTALADPWLQLALGLPALDAETIADWVEQVGERRLNAIPSAFAPVLARREDAVPIDLADESLLLNGLLGGVAAEAVRVASSALLREFAYRLAGMATASAEYLRRNVLVLDAELTREPERIAVELGRPPLDVLLSMAGLNRGSFTLPATGDVAWVLTSAR